MLINLKPRDARTAERQRDHPPPRSARPPSVARHHALHAAGAGPDHRFDGQPHPVPVRAGEPQPGRLRRLGAAPDGPPARRCPRSPTSPPSCRARAWRLFIRIDRDAAARFGITPATIDNALYDAFGQRIVSTIFTQSNQYRVILRGRAADGAARLDCARSTSTCRARPPASRCRCRRSPPSRSAPRRCRSTIWASSRPPPSRSTWRRAPRSAQAVDAIVAAQKEIGMPRQHQHPLPGRGARLPGGARQPAAADPGGDRHRLHRAGRALRELHPPDHDPLDPAVGRHRRAAGADARRRTISASSPSSASCC